MSDVTITTGNEYLMIFRLQDKSYALYFLLPI